MSSLFFQNFKGLRFWVPFCVFLLGFALLFFFVSLLLAEDPYSEKLRNIPVNLGPGEDLYPIEEWRKEIKKQKKKEQEKLGTSLERKETPPAELLGIYPERKKNTWSIKDPLGRTFFINKNRKLYFDPILASWYPATPVLENAPFHLAEAKMLQEKKQSYEALLIYSSLIRMPQSTEDPLIQKISREASRELTKLLRGRNKKRIKEILKEELIAGMYYSGAKKESIFFSSHYPLFFGLRGEWRLLSSSFRDELGIHHSYHLQKKTLSASKTLPAKIFFAIESRVLRRREGGDYSSSSSSSLTNKRAKQHKWSTATFSYKRVEELISSWRAAKESKKSSK